MDINKIVDIIQAHPSKADLILNLGGMLVVCVGGYRIEFTHRNRIRVYKKTQEQVDEEEEIAVKQKSDSYIIDG